MKLILQSVGAMPLLCVFTILLTAGTVEAQATASLAVIPQSTPAMPGSIATASVTVLGSLPISGFSYGLSHDNTILALTAPNVTAGGAITAAQSGLGPDFLSIDIFANGFTFATVINTDVAGTDLLANTAHEVTLLSYTVAPTATFGTTSLTFTGALGTPAVALSEGMGTEFDDAPAVTNATVFTTITFQRGDVNENGQVTISDVIYLLTQLFAGVPLTCLDAADIDGNLVLAISDAIFMLSYLFDGGTPMPAPIGVCGVPDAPSALGCASFACP